MIGPGEQRSSAQYKKSLTTAEQPDSPQMLPKDGVPGCIETIKAAGAKNEASLQEKS